MLNKIKNIFVENLLTQLKGDIWPLAKEFIKNSKILASIDRDWRNILLVQRHHTKSTSEFWIQVKMFNDSIGLNPFENLANFAIDVGCCRYHTELHVQVN